MQTFILERDNAPKLGFFGEQVAYAKVRWREAFVFKTKGGKFIVYTVKVANGVAKKRGSVLESLEDIRETLGQNFLAKRVYRLLGIDNTRRVE